MILSTLCYLERDGRYLMLHRVKKKNDINHDKWIGVGGKFEPDESPEECMLREIEEETGLRATEWSHRGILTFISNEAETEYIHLYLVTDWTGELKECAEGDLEWVEKEKVPELPGWEGDKIFLRYLLDPGMPFFSLKFVYEGDRLVYTECDGRTLQT